MDIHLKAGLDNQTIPLPHLSRHLSDLRHFKVDFYLNLFVSFEGYLFIRIVLWFSEKKHTLPRKEKKKVQGSKEKIS